MAESPLVCLLSPLILELRSSIILGDALTLTLLHQLIPF